MNIPHKEQVMQAALELGFDAVAVAHPAPTEHGPYFDRWLAEGRQGDMDWLARDPDRRKHVEKILPGARSVIVVAWNYHVTEPALQANLGLVARYARGKDYHKTMEKRLRQLAERIESIGGPDTRARSTVDTAAVLERELAQRSGLAWVGKSTIALNRQFGTWFLLGEVITTLDLEADAPAMNRCGSCTRCIEACPTQAITAPYQLDARKCIAYLTNEAKGDIPEEYRRAVGNRIFGCDDCLAICPWNRFAQEARSFREIYREDLVQLDARAILEMGGEAFEKQFSGTPIRRLGLERLQRNACVVLGNVGEKADMLLLEKTVSGHESDMVRRHALWACGEIKSRPSTNAVVTAPGRA